MCMAAQSSGRLRDVTKMPALCGSGLDMLIRSFVEIDPNFGDLASRIVDRAGR